MKRWRRGAFAITRRCSDTVIGIIEAPISFEGVGVLGCCLAEKYRGNGYMTEAVEAMKIYMFDHHWADEINIYVYCGNDASRNVTLKCGFFPKYSSYKEMIYSPHGDVQSEERLCITKEDYEWEKSGRDFFTT